MSKYLMSVNGDLWQQYFAQDAEERKVPIKVKAHRRTAEAVQGGDFWAYIANSLADAAASAGADIFRDEPYERRLSSLSSKPHTY